MFKRIIKKIKKNFLKIKAGKRRRERLISNNPFLVKNEKDLKEYMRVRKKLRKVDLSREKRRNKK